MLILPASDRQQLFVIDEDGPGKIRGWIERPDGSTYARVEGRRFASHVRVYLQCNFQPLPAPSPLPATSRRGDFGFAEGEMAGRLVPQLQEQAQEGGLERSPFRGWEGTTDRGCRWTIRPAADGDFDAYVWLKPTHRVSRWALHTYEDALTFIRNLAGEPRR
jgi:hypothetical protein